MKIEAILFDLGKVLIDFSFETAIQALYASCSISRDRFEEVLWDRAWICRYERGEICTSEFHRYLRETANLNVDLPDFCKIWSSVFLPGLMVSESRLAWLKRRYPLILVSNTNEAHIEFIRSNYPVLNYFDQHIFSYQVGSVKPDRKIFERAIAASGCPAKALFFTDDREENIVAARRLGMQVHQFQTESKLVEALHEAGVEAGEFVRG